MKYINPCFNLIFILKLLRLICILHFIYTLIGIGVIVNVLFSLETLNWGEEKIRDLRKRIKIDGHGQLLAHHHRLIK